MTAVPSPPSSSPQTSSHDSVAPPPPLPAGGEFVIALAGNPNVGKTTLFNALTGLKQKVANYPGVTVEKKVGRCTLSTSAHPIECQIIDLPGTYSLASRSPDEHVARQVVLGQIPGTPRPDVVVVVADGSNLERNLYLVTQVLELGRPVVLALSMMDVAESQGKRIEVQKLSGYLKIPVVPVQAHKKSADNGIAALKTEIVKASHHASVPPLELELPYIMESHIERLQKLLVSEGLSGTEQSRFDAHLLLAAGDDEAEAPDARRDNPKIRAELAAAVAACEKEEVDPIAAEVEAHYAYITSIVHECVREEAAAQDHRISRTDHIDRIVTHKFWGMLIFIGIMGLVFWTIFSWAQPLMDFLQNNLVGGLGDFIGAHMGDGPLKSLLVDGIIGGVGNVVVFVPQIALLFLFLAVLEDSGYMSRAAFLMDKLMSRVGLHGKSFIPLLSGYACAVPAIMGSRVIENRRDRLATILVLPLMSCSARLPIYLLIIAAFFGGVGVGVHVRQALIMLAMYSLGTLAAFAFAWLFKRTLLKGPTPAFILEMPPYRVPNWRGVVATVSQRCWAFLRRAGTLIFAFSVIMWAATHYPDKTVGTSVAREVAALQEQQAKLQDQIDHTTSTQTEDTQWRASLKDVSDQLETKSNELGRDRLEHSVAGHVGQAIAPVFKPLGYDWKLSIGVTGAFFAREVIVSTMGIVYSVGAADEQNVALQQQIASSYSPLVGISLMVFVVFCMQCLSTLAVAKREMGHWGWPVFMFVYMTGLAWMAAFVVYQGGLLLGFK